jgi:hypothetical protein
MRGWTLVAFAGSMFVASVAHAQAARDPVLAETAFRDAQRLKSAGKIPEACARFAESQRLDPQTGTLLNLAICHESEGKTATAWGEYGEVVAQAEAAGQKDRLSFTRERVTAIEKKLSYAALDAPPNGGLSEVKLDGKVIGQALWTTPLPLDPGEHKYDLQATGKKPRALAITVPPGPGTMHVSVPPFEDVDRPAEAPATATPVHPSEASKTSEWALEPSTLRTVGFVVAGVGLVGLGVGSYFGVRAMSLKGDVDDHCRGAGCDDLGFAAQRDAHGASDAATVLMTTGAIALAAGAVLVLVSPRSR